jgi:hypothetical protein
MAGKPKSRWSAEALAAFEAKKAAKSAPPVDPLTVGPPAPPKTEPTEVVTLSNQATEPPVEGADIRKEQAKKKKSGINYDEIEASVPGLVKVTTMAMQVPIRAVCAMPNFPYEAKFRELTDGEAAAAAAAMKPALKEILPTLFEDHPFATVALIMSSCVVGTVQFEKKPEKPTVPAHVAANNMNLAQPPILQSVNLPVPGQQVPIPVTA